MGQTVQIRPPRTVRIPAEHWSVIVVHRNLYHMTPEVIAMDRGSTNKRHCQKCNGKFAPGDGVSVAITEQGNKLLCPRCVEALVAFLGWQWSVWTEDSGRGRVSARPDGPVR